MKRGEWLAARLGLDGNSLRRRTDRIAVYGTIGLLVMFLVATPILAISAGHWAYRWSISQQQGQRSWHQVTAVLLQKAPVQPDSYDTGWSWTPARWTPPGGHVRRGVISVPAGMPAGSRVRILAGQRRPVGRAAARPADRRDARGDGGYGHDRRAGGPSGRRRVRRPLAT